MDTGFEEFLMSSRFPAVTAALLKAGVTEVCMKYDGHHGDRTIEPPTYCRKSMPPMLLATIDMEIARDLQVFFTRLLSLRFPDWETGKGARGEFFWQLDHDLLQHEHAVRGYTYRNQSAALGCPTKEGSVHFHPARYAALRIGFRRETCRHCRLPWH